MENTTSHLIEHVLILLVLIFGLGMFFGKAAQWLKLPDVALFLVAGMLAGQAFHWIDETSTSFTNQFILVLGSSLILFDGGRNIRLTGLRKVWLTVGLLSIPGVLLTCGAVAVIAHLLLDLPWLYALLLGAIIASTDPATLIPVFKQVKIRTKVRETVESESAFNDATASILTFSLLAIILGTEKISIASGILDFVKTALGGLALGAVIGFGMTYLTAHSRLGLLRDYATIAMVVTSLGAYIAGEYVGVSGFMATFTAGLMWGNAETFKLNMQDKRHEMDHFSDNMTVIMRMLIFILLGSQVNFPLIVANLWTSLGVIFVFIFVARPLTVLACTWPDRKAGWTWREILFMFWVRETGVIPAALSGMVAGLGVAHSELIASVTFMAVLITILFQASTTAYVARKLGLEVKAEGTDIKGSTQSVR
ncbi:transporter monovalent cation:proton antiporter-2 (CPA2) family protein [Paenibacillus marchantiophytorum]|uniref:Transporter monovalent cation:proton antiporter-2 (CPA2) family protein n=1 Tax=Paenibacillus marchantiophytorum TaxID=1619310 RepID=A0ABQ1EL27_9BACL|nr:cation:proton antiporter [Paenibacillus marchantiophytorum]GFZ76462.1 transporter monovalent cation:proton antiporter-2 (CPA2) family protein [Paenibacillus marchantiophytorum]